MQRTIPADAYEYNKSVNVDFEFSRSIALKEMVFYTAAMSTGNVGNPSMYYIYVSDDGENYTREAVATMGRKRRGKRTRACSNHNYFG